MIGHRPHKVKPQRITAGRHGNRVRLTIKSRVMREGPVFLREDFCDLTVSQAFELLDQIAGAAEAIREEEYLANAV